MTYEKLRRRAERNKKEFVSSKQRDLMPRCFLIYEVEVLRMSQHVPGVAEIQRASVFYG